MPSHPTLEPLAISGADIVLRTLEQAGEAFFPMILPGGAAAEQVEWDDRP